MRGYFWKILSSAGLRVVKVEEFESAMHFIAITFSEHLYPKDPNMWQL